MMNILFLCTGNSCRSQMAEGFARALKADSVEAFSAGIEKHGMNPWAVKVMAEVGIDITPQFSKTLDELHDQPLDVVITVCGHAHETCPWFPGDSRIIHHGFDDPPKLAEGLGLSDEQAILECYRTVRDQIREYVEALPGTIN